MRTLILRFTFACLFAIIAIGCSEDNSVGPGGSSAITGRVIDALTNAPLAGASISTTPATQTVVTDTAGNFTIANVAAGTYAINASRAGYANATLPVTMTGSQNLNVVIPMVVGNGSDSLGIPWNPMPPDNAAGQPTYITLQWSVTGGKRDSLRYDVYFGTNPDPVLAVADITDTTLLRSGLELDKLYYWRVIVRNNKGQQQSGPVWSFRTTTLQNNNPPAIPFEPSPANGVSSQPYTLTLRWKCSDPDGDPLKYDILFGTNPTPSDPIVSDQLGTSYQVSNLQENTTYFWRVVAKDNHNGITSSPVWTFTTKTNLAPNAPYGPTPANGAIDQSVTLTLRWNGSDDDGDALTYDVYLGTSNPPTELAVTGHSTTSFKPPAISGETTYFWRVVAKDGHGGQTSGQIWSFTTVGAPANRAPNTPSNPTPAHGAGGQSTSLTLRWSASDPDGDPVRFDVYLGTDNPPTQPVSSDRTSASYALSALTPGVTYFWRVVAKDNRGGVTNGPVWSFATDSPPDLTPRLVAYYPFNGDANDGSGNGHHGTVIGATLTADRHGKANNAYSFGEDKFVIVPHTSDLTMAQNDFTVAAWINLAGNQSDYAGIAVKCTPNAPERGYQLIMRTNNIFAGQYGTQIPTGQVYFDVAGSTVSIGSWHFVAMVISRQDKSVKLYLDGVLQQETTAAHLSYSMNNDSPLLIGTERQQKRFFNGAIDDVRIYNYALSASDIQQLASQ
jgi:hypothetical protein